MLPVGQDPHVYESMMVSLVEAGLTMEKLATKVCGLTVQGAVVYSPDGLPFGTIASDAQGHEVMHTHEPVRGRFLTASELKLILMMHTHEPVGGRFHLNTVTLLMAMGNVAPAGIAATVKEHFDIDLPRVSPDKVLHNKGVTLTRIAEELFGYTRDKDNQLIGGVYNTSDEPIRIRFNKEAGHEEAVLPKAFAVRPDMSLEADRTVGTTDFAMLHIPHAKDARDSRKIITHALNLHQAVKAGLK